MTQIEQNIVASLNRDWGGKACFGNSRVYRRGCNLKFLLVKVKGKETPIFAKTGNGYFWCDPCDKKNKLINSRLSMLKENFSAKEIRPEIMSALERVGRVNNYWTRNEVYEVTLNNNHTRYFRTKKGAEDFSKGKGATIAVI